VDSPLDFDERAQRGSASRESGARNREQLSAVQVAGPEQKEHEKQHDDGIARSAKNRGRATN